MGALKLAVELPVAELAGGELSLAVKPALVGDPADAEVETSLAALRERHPEVPVLIAALAVPLAVPAADLLEHCPAEHCRHGVLVRVRDPEGIQPLGYRAHDLSVAELRVVTEAGDGALVHLEGVGHRCERAGHCEVVRVEREQELRSRRAKPGTARARGPRVLRVPDDPHAFRPELVED